MDLKSRIPSPLRYACLAAGLLCLTPSTSASTEVDLAWNAATVEHLLNRAGFGAQPHEIERWVPLGPRRLVAHLLDVRPPEDPYFYERQELPRDELARLSADERRRTIGRLRAADKKQLQGFVAWWVDEMVTGDHPLRERMTLFWHGFFTSSSAKVKRSFAMIEQNELFREHALGSYADLLREIVRDPAMLEYLDNGSNKKDHPNENLAREVMELFSLGEGNYTEDDVKQAARALTGRAFDRREGYWFRPRYHDFGRKTILGVKGRHDGDDLVDILLAQDACARWVAGRLVEYLEGVAPSEERLERYAALLRRNNYEVRPLLSGLFLDPDFYRAEVVGGRVSSPIDFLVGSCRRLGIDPPAAFLAGGSGLLGQKLLDPPNVKGWEEGAAWITTATLMQRGNLVGALLGVVDSAEASLAPVDLLAAAGEAAMDGDEVAVDLDDDEMMAGSEAMAPVMEAPPRGDKKREKTQFDRMLALMDKANYRPRIHLSARCIRKGLSTDAEIVAFLTDKLLAIEAPAETLEVLEEYLVREREAAGIEADRLLLSGSSAERVLRRLAHLILSLPEAQLS